MALKRDDGKPFTAKNIADFKTAANSGGAFLGIVFKAFLSSGALPSNLPATGGGPSDQPGIPNNAARSRPSSISGKKQTTTGIF